MCILNFARRGCAPMKRIHRMAGLIGLVVLTSRLARASELPKSPIHTGGHGKDIWQFPNGLTMTYVEQPASDLAQLTDAHLWRFKLRFAKPDTAFEFTLQVREGGKLIQGFGGFIGGPWSPPPQSLMVGAAPLDFDIRNSKKVSFMVEGYIGTRDHGGYRQVEDNPFNGANGESELIGSAWQEQAAIPLMLLDMPPKDKIKVVKSSRDLRPWTLVLAVKTQIKPQPK